MLKWDEPEDDGGTPLTYFIIERMDLNKKDKWTEVGEVVADIREFKCSQLAEGNKYRFRIRALNIVGPSEPAELEDSVLAKDPWDIPGPPINVEITDWDKHYADLVWEAPENDGGAKIMKYVVECKEKFGKEWVKCCMTEDDVCKAKVEDVICEGKTYEFRVKAINKGGEGEASIPTKSIICKSRFVKPFIVGDKMTDIIVKRGQHLSWDIKYGGEPDPEIEWFFNDVKIQADDR